MSSHTQVYWPGELAPVGDGSVRFLIGWKNNESQYCVGSHVSLEDACQLRGLLEDTFFLEDATTKSLPMLIGICYGRNVTKEKLFRALDALEKEDPEFLTEGSLIMIQISDLYIPMIPTNITE